MTSFCMQEDKNPENDLENTLKKGGKINAINV